MLTHRGVVIAVGSLMAMVALLIPERQASAVPSFSREHGLKCDACHTAFPRLNDFGMEFKQRGYRLPDTEGKHIWDQKTLPLSIIGVARYNNQQVNDPVTGERDRSRSRSRFEIDEIEVMAAGTAAPKLGYWVEMGQDVAEGGEFGVEQAWGQYSDLLPAAALNIRGGLMRNEFFYLAQKRRLTFQQYLAPVTFNITGVELNGQRGWFRYAAGIVNDERKPGTNPSAVNLDNKTNGFYGWATVTLADQILGIRYINTKANSDLLSPVIDGRTRQQLDVNLNLRYGPGELILGYFHNWDIGGVAHQDRRNYLVEGILEAVPETLYLDARFELQDTGFVPGGNNPSMPHGTLVAVNASWLVYQNFRVIAEYNRQRGEGLGVLDLRELTTVADRNQQRYLLGVQIGF